MKRLLPLLLGLLCFAGSIPPSQQQQFFVDAVPPVSGGGGGSTSDPSFVTSQSFLGDLRNNFTGGLGVDFTPDSNGTITWLGMWIVAGNTQTHAVHLYAAATHTELAVVSVNCSIGTPGTYTKIAITPVPIVGGVTYSVHADFVSGGDQWYNSTETYTFASGFSGIQASYYTTSYGSGGGNVTYVPVNFGFH